MMTEQEKQVLFKDLCARLPYDTIINVNDGKYRKDVKLHPHYIFDWDAERWDAKPYLRPMASMSKEEKQESRWYRQNAKSDNFIVYMGRYEEWLDSNHFDWRTDGNGKTMIELGLALEAPEGMYNTKTE